MIKKTIDSEIAKYQKKIDELNAKKEKISRNVIDSVSGNLSVSITAVVGLLTMRYEIPWLLFFNDTMNRFEVIGYDTHENQYVFDIEGRIRQIDCKGDYSFPLTGEEQETIFPSYFCVKFSLDEDGAYTISSVKIDVNTGKIVSEDKE